MRHLSPVGNGRSLWDVENVEAHVRTTLDAALAGSRARLQPQQHQRAFAFMWALCWEISGLEGDGVTLRYVWEIHGLVAPTSTNEEFIEFKSRQLPTEARAAELRDEIHARSTAVLTTMQRVRPNGAYDKKHGLSFSTYSRRVMTRRLPDWYRTDPEFGDNRYDGNRLEREVSFEALAERRRADVADDAAFLDRSSPGSRLDFVDDLNRHAYQESIEEVLMRETASG